MRIHLYEEWLQNWRWILRIAERRQWEIRKPLSVLPPCSVSDFDQLINDSQLIIPREFIHVCTEFSANVSFSWYMNEADQEWVNDIFSGGSEPLWSIEALKQCKIEYNGWLTECFADASDAYNQVWHNKTAFISVANGDMIAFDVSAGNENCPVVYLSHDGDEDAHGKILGQNFFDFISRWSVIGCPGTEFWQMQPFYHTTSREIDINGRNAKDWLHWLR